MPDQHRPWRPAPGTPLGATFYVRSGSPFLAEWLETPPLRSTLSPGIAGIIGWGGRAPARFARMAAAARGLPYWAVEDGFLRSVALGKSGALPHSIVVDDLGLYFDARRPSRLEALIRDAAAGRWRSEGEAVRRRVVAEGLTKYNHLPHRVPDLGSDRRRRILLVDQVAGDQSIPAALGDAASFRRMAEDAAATGARCLVRTHPDVMAGYRRGYLADLGLLPPHYELLAEQVSAPALVEAVDEVWTVSSQMGFDALMRGKAVRTYAAPFYAGWGLTEDRPGPAAGRALARRNGASPTVDDLTAAALVHYPIYRDPETGRRRDVHETIGALAAERRSAG